MQLPASLVVNCLIDDKIPAGGVPAWDEVIRLNVKDLINLNETVHSGFTVFIPE